MRESVQRMATPAPSNARDSPSLSGFEGAASEEKVEVGQPAVLEDSEVDPMSDTSSRRRSASPELGVGIEQAALTEIVSSRDRRV